MKIKDLFRRKRDEQPQTAPADSPTPLRIEGVPDAPLTPEPDDAELAAQALLESMSLPPAPSHRGGAKKHHGKHPDHSPSGHSAEANSQLSTLNSQLPEERDAAYYRHLADKIRQTREHQRLRVTRFLAFCEQELKKRYLPAYGPGSLGLLEAELYKRMDIVDREGGAIKERWQHCLAQVTVRLMKLSHTESAERADGDKTSIREQS